MKKYILIFLFILSCQKDDNSLFNQNLSSWNVTNVSNCSVFSAGASNWSLPKPNFTNCSE